ncbi:ATP-binding cassette domain-containing protein [bacterium]|nr:ATP-binding cassette domain-containing protein [bacterium]
MIKVQNLTKRYGSTVAVNNISFEVKQGEVLGFLGPNGAGKTTTMRILTCYMPPDEGKVTIAGHDIFSDSLAIRKMIGYLPENAPLYNNMGVVDYLNFIAEIRGIDPVDRRSRVKEMVTLCGLEKVVGKIIGHLSKGYRQRVGLAQTLIHDPDILILDEPTVGLDPSQIKEIRELIKSIGEKKTIILCTHILPEVSMTCKRVLIINEGQIAASGTPEELSMQAGGTVTIRLGIKAEREQINQTLSGMSQIKDFKYIETDRDNFHAYVLSGTHEASAVDLFHLAVDKGWTLNELSLSKATLEEVFLNLTIGEK